MRKRIKSNYKRKIWESVTINECVYFRYKIVLDTNNEEYCGEKRIGIVLGLYIPLASTLRHSTPYYTLPRL